MKALSKTDASTRDSIRFSLIQQAILFVLGGLMLDGGVTGLVVLYTLAAYWGGFFVIIARRRRKLTSMDKFLIKWGFLMLLPISLPMAVGMWRLRGFE